MFSSGKSNYWKRRVDIKIKKINKKPSMHVPDFHSKGICMKLLDK